MNLKNSNDIAKMLCARMEEVSKGENLAGADTLCRLVETFIKLATLEIQYANARGMQPAAAFLKEPEAAGAIQETSEAEQPARTTPEIAALEAELAEIDAEIAALPAHSSKIKQLNTMAGPIRAQLLRLRDEIEQDPS
jgi:hypothetical protein